MNGLRRIKKKKIPIYDGRAGVLPPIITTDGDETLDSANSERKYINNLKSRHASLDEINNDLPKPVNSVRALKQGRNSL